MERIKVDPNLGKRFSSKRAIITKQVKEASYELIDIEADFLDELFDEDNPKTYQELYSDYSLRYYLKAKELNENTISCVEVKKEYFSNHYFPIEGK